MSVAQNVAQPLFCKNYGGKKKHANFGNVIFQKNCQKKTIVQQAKIRPIWSP
jgi:hypothetical protein